MGSAKAASSIGIGMWLAAIVALGAVAGHGVAAAAGTGAAVTRIRAGDPTTAQPPVESWWNSRDYTSPVLLAITLLTLAVAALSFFIAASRQDNGPLVALMLAIGLPCLLTSCNSLFLTGDAFRMSAYDAVGMLFLGLMIMSPGLVPIWLGINLYLAAGRSWAGALGMVLVLAGLGWLLLVYNYLTNGRSPYG